MRLPTARYLAAILMADWTLYPLTGVRNKVVTGIWQKIVQLVR